MEQLLQVWQQPRPAAVAKPFSNNLYSRGITPAYGYKSILVTGGEPSREYMNNVVMLNPLDTENGLEELILDKPRHVNSRQIGVILKSRGVIKHTLHSDAFNDVSMESDFRIDYSPKNRRVLSVSLKSGSGQRVHSISFPDESI